MERWLRTLAAVPQEPLAVGAVAVSAVLIVGAFAAAALAAPVRAASVAAAGLFLLLIVVGVSLYAWRLGAPGRSE